MKNAPLLVINERSPWAFAKSSPTSQTKTLSRSCSGARKASRLPSGEISAPLIFGLSKKSAIGIFGDCSSASAVSDNKRLMDRRTVRRPFMGDSIEIWLRRRGTCSDCTGRHHW